MSIVTQMNLFSEEENLGDLEKLKNRELSSQVQQTLTYLIHLI